VNNYVEITNKDVIDFLKEKSKVSVCNFCHSDKLILEKRLDGGALGALFLEKVQLAKKFSNSEFALYCPLICESCGYTLLFLRSIIIDWKLAKQEAKDE
jgi:hypothetical protein